MDTETIVAVDRRAVLARLLREARPYYPRLLLALGLGVIAGLGPLSYTEAVNLVIQHVLAPPQPDWRILWFVVIGLFAVGEISNAASYGQNYLTAWSGQRLIANLRVALFSRVMRLPLGEFDRWRPGEFLARFTNDLSLMTDAISISLPQLIQTIITLLGALVILLSRLAADCCSWSARSRPP